MYFHGYFWQILISAENQIGNPAKVWCFLWLLKKRFNTYSFMHRYFLSALGCCRGILWNFKFYLKVNEMFQLKCLWMFFNYLFFLNLIFKLINMANLLIIHILSNCVAANYHKMRKIILKLHKSSSVDFIKRSLFIFS